MSPQQGTNPAPTAAAFRDTLKTMRPINRAGFTTPRRRTVRSPPRERLIAAGADLKHTPLWIAGGLIVAGYVIVKVL